MQFSTFMTNGIAPLSSVPVPSRGNAVLNLCCCAVDKDGKGKKFPSPLGVMQFSTSKQQKLFNKLIKKMVPVPSRGNAVLNEVYMWNSIITLTV